MTTLSTLLSGFGFINRKHGRAQRGDLWDRAAQTPVSDVDIG